MIWVLQLTKKDYQMQFLSTLKQENAYSLWEKLLKLWHKDLGFQEKDKTEWLYKVIKKLTKLKKLAILNVILIIIKE